MSMHCDLCGKKTMHGHSIKHKHSKGWKYRAPNTKRTWKPNLRKVKIQDNKSGKISVVTMCMSCYRKYTTEGVSFINKKNPKVYRKLEKGSLVKAK